jgi:predicted nucleic acid-binding protein
MPNDIFVDTSGFFALLVARDPHHDRCAELVRDLGTRRGRAFTSEAIIGETCTLLQARRQGHLIGGFLDYVDASRALTVLPVGTEMFRRTKDYLRRRFEHGFSFVDCSSFLHMADFRLTDALTTDEHFRIAGLNPMLC